MKSSRRTFLISSIGVASALAVSRTAFADPVKLTEADPMAQGLGYKLDATTVDKIGRASCRERVCSTV